MNILPIALAIVATLGGIWLWGFGLILFSEWSQGAPLIITHDEGGITVIAVLCRLVLKCMTLHWQRN
jgi:hypothetical protein